jgi:hypothetical protein
MLLSQTWGPCCSSHFYSSSTRIAPTGRSNQATNSTSRRRLDSGTTETPLGLKGLRSPIDILVPFSSRALPITLGIQPTMSTSRLAVDGRVRLTRV